jgi:hypothetical protein
MKGLLSEYTIPKRSRRDTPSFETKPPLKIADVNVR